MRGTRAVAAPKHFCADDKSQAPTHTPEILQKKGTLVVIFVFLKLLLFCFVVAVCDLVHNVEAIHGLC